MACLRAGLELHRLDVQNVDGLGRYHGCNEVHSQGRLARRDQHHFIGTALLHSARMFLSFKLTCCGYPQAQEKGLPQHQGPPRDPAQDSARVDLQPTPHRDSGLETTLGIVKGSRLR